MKVTQLELPGVKVLEPKYFEDHRGYFCETYSQRTLAEEGIDCVFVQDNHSMTKSAGTIRGIHFQNAPSPQAKLVRCTRGRIRDVIVDLRRDSPTFRKWVSVELSEDNRKQVFIPAGYGHAFMSLEDNCEVQYKASSFYDPALDRSVAWNDPDIGIDWDVETPVVSAKDAAAPRLADSDVNLLVEERS